MARDYKKEHSSRVSKSKRFQVYIDKDLAEQFLAKLDGKPFSTWVRENIDIFLKSF